jgi:hypothetical protein
VSVGIATGYGLDGQDSIPGIAKFFFSPQRSDRPLGSPSILSNGYRGPFRLGVKRQGREADRSAPSSVEVKKGGALFPPPHALWHGA